MHVDLHGNCFVTLTYRDKSECTAEQLKNGYYVPADYSLNKNHFQKFIRRLRKRYPQKIRYFHCGEYGDENKRPHYHACLFNISFRDQRIYKETEGIVTFSSAILNELWPYGFSTVGELNYETASYTAGYILKKVNGPAADDEYLRSDEYGVCFWVQPPYITMSLKRESVNGKKVPGGIGGSFYEKYKTDFYDDSCPVPGKGVFRKIPRYYESIMQSDSPDTLENIKGLRKAFKEAHMEDFTPERLHDKYICARANYTKKRTL